MNKSKNKNRKSLKILNYFEAFFHIVLIVAVPYFYLDITTDFNKYKLPDQIIFVYLYWFAYLIIIPSIYHILNKNKNKNKKQD